jgi:hypothetical protein
MIYIAVLVAVTYIPVKLGGFGVVFVPRIRPCPQREAWPIFFCLLGASCPMPRWR